MSDVGQVRMGWFPDRLRELQAGTPALWGHPSWPPLQKEAKVGARVPRTRGVLYNLHSTLSSRIYSQCGNLVRPSQASAHAVLGK